MFFIWLLKDKFRDISCRVESESFSAQDEQPRVRFQGWPSLCRWSVWKMTRFWHNQLWMKMFTVLAFKIQLLRKRQIMPVLWQIINTYPCSSGPRKLNFDRLSIKTISGLSCFAKKIYICIKRKLLFSCLRKIIHWSIHCGNKTMLIVFLGSNMILGLDLHLTNLRVLILILKCCCCKATYLILSSVFINLVGSQYFICRNGQVLGNPHWPIKLLYLSFVSVFIDSA